MAHQSHIALVALVLVSVTGMVGADAGNKTKLNITNRCEHKVWPEIISSGASSSSAAPDTTGFELAPGHWEMVPVPPGWAGRVTWARTLSPLCSSSTTGSSGDNKHQDCAAATGGPVKDVDGSGGTMHDLYDVNLVDGFNLPVMVEPQGGGNYCAPTGCMVNMNGGGGNTTYAIAITFCPASTTSSWTGGVARRSQLDRTATATQREAEAAAGGGIAPSVGVPPAAARASGLTTADKVVLAFFGGVLTVLCGVGLYFCTVAVYKRWLLQPQPAEELAVSDEELARASTTSTRGISGRSDSTTSSAAAAALLVRSVEG